MLQRAGDRPCGSNPEIAPLNPKKPLILAMVACAVLFWSTLARSEHGVTKTSIVLGQSVAQGAKLYFDRVNATGGVHGRSIDLVTLDDAGLPANTVANTRKLVSQGVIDSLGRVRE